MIDTTIVLLCHKRPQTFNRAMSFYEKYSKNLKIVVLVSGYNLKSNYNLKEKTNNIKIIFSRKKLNYKIEEGLKFVDTEFVVLCGIDDFIFYNSIIKCKNFLLKNKDYISCHGRYYLHKTASELKNNQPFFIDVSSKSFSISHKLSFKRAKHYLKERNTASTNFYALFRTNFLKRILKLINKYNSKVKIDPTISFEVMFCLLSHVLGKTKHFEIMYSSKEKHKIIPNASLTISKEKNLIKNFLKFINQELNSSLKLGQNDRIILDKLLIHKFNLILKRHSSNHFHKIIKILKFLNLYKFVRKIYIVMSRKENFDHRYTKKDLLEQENLKRIIVKFSDVENESNLSRENYVKSI